MTVTQFGRRILGVKYQQGVNEAEVLSLFADHQVTDACTVTLGTVTDGFLPIYHTLPGGGGTALYTVAMTGNWLVIDNSLNQIASGYSDAIVAAMFRTMGQSAAAIAATTEFADAVKTQTTRAFTNNASRSLTTSTGAAGFQVSATRDAVVGYDVTLSTTATIGGAASSLVLLEIAPTNSATAGDWLEIARLSNTQTITLAAALQSVQGLGGRLSGVVPAGWYAKLRQTNTGTASATYNTGQEVLL